MKNDSMFKRIVRAAIGDNAAQVTEKIAAAVGDNAFINMVSGLGTARDKASAGEYMPARRKSVNELTNTYHQDWVAQRIINKPAQDALRAGWYYGKLEDDQNQAVIKEFKRLKVHKALLRAMVLSRLHGWSYILIGADDNVDLTEPLDIQIEGLSFLTVLKREQIKPKKDGECLSAAITGGSFTEPEMYQMGSDWNPKYIHHTRVIRFDAPDPVGCDDGLPMPVLQQIYETLIRNVSVNANASSLVYEAKVDVFKVKNLVQGLAANPSGTINGLIARFAANATLKGNNGAIVMDVDEQYESKSFTFTGLPELMREFAVQTAGAAEMPYALLFGQSPAGMNSTGDFDMRSYYDGISTMQQNVLREPLEQLLAMITESLGYDVDDIGLTFNPLWQLDEKTKSEVEKNNAERDEKYLERGIVTESQVARQLVDDGTYTTISEDHIKLLEDMDTQTYELENESSPS